MRQIRIGDECLSKTFGYGHVNSIIHKFVEVIFPIPNWDSKKCIKCIYNFNGELMSTLGDFDSNKIERSYIDVNAKFYLEGVRHILFEKTFCNG